jgi:hypothetical protein
MKAMISRRSLLATGVAAGGVIALGGTAAHLGAPLAGYRVLAQGEVDIVEAVAAVLFPPGLFPVAGGDGGTAPEVDRLLAEMVEPSMVSPFRYLLRALEWGTFVSRGSRFTELDPETAEAVVDIWASGRPFPRRMAFTSIQALLGLAFFRREEVVQAIGWRAGCFG